MNLKSQLNLDLFNQQKLYVRYQDVKMSLLFGAPGENMF